MVRCGFGFGAEVVESVCFGSCDVRVDGDPNGRSEVGEEDSEDDIDDGSELNEG